MKNKQLEILKELETQISNALELIHEGNRLFDEGNLKEARKCWSESTKLTKMYYSAYQEALDSQLFA